MGIGTGRCCVDCQTYFVPYKNDIVVLETFEDGRDYKLWSADLLICPLCGHRIISGFGQSAFAEHYEPDFKEVKEKCKQTGVLFTISGCPHPAQTWDRRTN